MSFTQPHVSAFIWEEPFQAGCSTLFELLVYRLWGKLGVLDLYGPRVGPDGEGSVFFLHTHMCAVTEGLACMRSGGQC